jgi:hypothetical protein
VFLEDGKIPVGLIVLTVFRHRDFVLLTD